MACDSVPRFYIFELGLSIPAYVHDLQATRLEAATGRWINGLRDFASDFGNGSLIGRDRGLGTAAIRAWA